MADQPLQGRERRKLWRVDLNDVHVQDEQGNDYEVTLTRGVLNGPLTVTITSEDVPLSVAEALAAAVEQFEASGSPLVLWEAVAVYREAYPKPSATP